jgi:hypothetical protein
MQRRRSDYSLHYFTQSAAALPAYIEPLALVALHLGYAAVLAYPHSLGVVHIANLCSNITMAFITCHFRFSPKSLLPIDKFFVLEVFKPYLFPIVKRTSRIFLGEVLSLLL